MLGETKGSPGAALGAMKWFSVTCPEDLSSALCCNEGGSKINFGWDCSFLLAYLLVTHSCLHMKNACQPDS